MASTLDGPLNARLDAYVHMTRPLVPEISAAYDRMVDHVRRVLDQAESAGPAVGEEMPAFVLPDHQGRLVALSDLVARGPVVVSLNRGHWCPYCRLQLAALARATDLIVRAGATVVSLMPEPPAQTKRMIAERGLPYPVLSDLDFGYVLSLGLMIPVPEELQQLYLARGIDLARFQDGSGQFLPVAALFVVGTDGRVTARHVDAEFRRRMEPSDILSVLSGPSA